MKIKLVNIAIVSTIFIASCTAMKTTEKSKENSAVKASTEVSKDLNDVSNENVEATKNSTKDSASSISIAQIERRTGEWEFTHKLFDTSMPVDIATGTPPVKEITTYKSTQQSEQDYKSSTDVTFTQDEVSKIKSAIESKYSAKIDSLEKTNSQLNSTIASKETPVNKSWWIWFIAGVLVPVAIYFLIKIYLK